MHSARAAADTVTALRVDSAIEDASSAMPATQSSAQASQLGDECSQYFLLLAEQLERFADNVSTSVKEMESLDENTSTRFSDLRPSSNLTGAPMTHWALRLVGAK